MKIDRSLEYKTMCIESKEIQSEREHRFFDGDIYDNYSTYFVHQNKGDKIQFGVKGNSASPEAHVWIPKENQLIDLVVHKTQESHLSLFKKFYEKFFHTRTTNIPEGEKLWLMIYMWIRFDKKWESHQKAWVRI